MVKSSTSEGGQGNSCVHEQKMVWKQIYLKETFVLVSFFFFYKAQPT